MNSFSPAISQSSQDNSEVLVKVIVKQEADGRTVATVPGLPEIRVQASDVWRQVATRLRTTALAQLQQRLETPERWYRNCFFICKIAIY